MKFISDDALQEEEIMIKIRKTSALLDSRYSEAYEARKPLGGDLDSNNPLADDCEQLSRETEWPTSNGNRCPPCGPSPRSGLMSAK
jgi:hypothetical protein